MNSNRGNRSHRYIGILAFVSAQFVFSLPVYAAQQPVRLLLDAATIERGFTVESSDNNLRVGVTPKALGKRSQASVRIKHLSGDAVNLDGETLLSNVYS